MLRTVGLLGSCISVLAAACGRFGFNEAGVGSNGDARTGPCSTTGADVVFDATTTMVDRMTDPATAPNDGERVQLGNGSCPGFTGGLQQPYRAVVIANGGAQPVTISAWATCVAGDLAVLTYFRRGRRRSPASSAWPVSSVSARTAARLPPRRRARDCSRAHSSGCHSQCAKKRSSGCRPRAARYRRCCTSRRIDPIAACHGHSRVT